MAGAFKRVAIFGAGVSGQAAKRLAVQLGLEVCLFDEGGQGDALNFDPVRLNAFDAFVFSPGFAMQHPWRVLAESSGRPCYSELGFAAQYWRGRLLGITGTNGKTTLTSLLCAALEGAGHVAVDAGNIGSPLSDIVLGSVNHMEAYAVCEISSFQAELSRGLRLDGLIWINFAEDHLDRYATMADYFAAKKRLFSCLNPDAPCIVGPSVVAFDSAVADIPHCELVAQAAEPIEALEPESPFYHYPQSENFALGAALWRALDLPLDALINSANTFQLAAHRLSQVETWGGVSFWDDSKATNFHAALAALDALAAQDAPIFWIGGGSPKGGDLEAFARTLAPRIEAAFLYGAAAEPLAAGLRPIHSRVETYQDFADAVDAATRAALAQSPAAVLLSPGFASFDQFSGYAERGKSFISTVLSLKDAHRLN